MAVGIDTTTLKTYTPTQLLVLVDYAIAQIMGGAQQYSIGGQIFTKASLTQLRDFRKELQTEVDGASGTTGVIKIGEAS